MSRKKAAGVQVGCSPLTSFSTSDMSDVATAYLQHCLDTMELSTSTRAVIGKTIRRRAVDQVRRANAKRRA